MSAASSEASSTLAAGTLLVVEDRDSLRRLMRRALRAEGFQVTTARNVAEGIRALDDDSSYDLVFSDLRLPDGTGVDFLERVRERDERIPFVILTAYGDVQSAVRAMKLGASDFLEKPVEIDELCALARRLAIGGSEGDDAEGAGPSGEAVALDLEGGPRIVGRHHRLLAAIKLLRRVAPSEGSVLLLGESGTGKELFAQALHALSPRKARPFVALNCAAVPAALVESELFGHEKGAFTGAGSRRKGRFELAAGGTLFLDEIGELELGVQAKLLRVLEERTFERLGGQTTLTADVRVVAATNVDLQTRVQDGGFRADLYYRLEVFPIELPPLRDRSSDIPELADHLLARACERNGLSCKTFSPAAHRYLGERSWPGNVRELSNVVERAVVLCAGDRIDVADLQALGGAIGRGAPDEEPSGPPSAAVSIADQSDQEFERRATEQALRDCDGDKKSAARQLGVSYRTLQRRIVRWDLEAVGKYRE